MQHYTTSNPYEKEFGYSRATKRGPFIFVSGTTSVDPTSGVLQGGEDAYEQTKVVFENIMQAVEGLGGTKKDVVRLRIFVAREEDVDGVGRGLKDFTRDVLPGPAATMIVGARFVDEKMKVEIEADAVVL
jgi:enamine deaminase RidA (YjgF/YER057c/UK114 family)